MIGLCMALILALTSGGMAVARGQTMAAGTMVLCTGSGPLVVPVDADGQPTGPAHVCPDCALSLIDAPSATGTTAVRILRATSASFSHVVKPAHGTATRAAQARGPPAV